MTTAIGLDPRNAGLLLARALIWEEAGEFQLAIDDYTAILRDKPTDVRTLVKRAHASRRRGDYRQAQADFESALQARPCSPAAINRVASLLAAAPDDRVRDGKRAIELATMACELTDWKQPYYLRTLAAANAEAGDFEHAVEWQTKAVALSAEKDRPSFQEHLALFEARKPLREGPTPVGRD